MKITHVLDGRCNPTSANGIDSMVYNLSQHQALMGHDVDIWQVTSKPPIPITGVETTELQSSVIPLKVPVQLDPVLKHRKPDVVHIHSVFSPACTTIGHYLARSGVPYVVTLHGGLGSGSLQSRRLKKQLYLRLFERQYLNKARAIHALSEREASVLPTLGITAPVFIASNGIATEPPPHIHNRQLLEECIPAARNKRIFLFMGRLAPQQKGLDLLIEAARIAKPHLKNALVVIAGADWRGQHKVLETQVIQAGLRDLVVFPGPFFGQDKFDLLSAADVFLHTSRWEGIPTSVLEAMLTGTPCLLTEETNMADFARDHGAGFVTECSSRGIAQNLVTLSQIPQSTLNAMGERAAQAVKSQFGWDTISRQITQHYASCKWNSDGGITHALAIASLKEWS